MGFGMWIPFLPLVAMAAVDDLVQITPMSHGNIFTVVGHIYTGSRDGHIIIPFNLKTLRERRNQLDAINKHIQSLNENMVYPSNDPKKKKLVLNNKNRRAIAWMKYWINQTVSENLVKIDDTLFSFTKNGTHLDDNDRRRRASPLAPELPVRRVKRQLIVGTIGAALGATIAGIVSKYNEDKLLHILDQKQKVIVSQLEENAVKIAQTSEDMIRLNQTVGKVIRAMYRLENQVNSTNFIAMTLTTTYSVTETVKQINHIISALDDARSGHFNTGLAKSHFLKNALLDLERQGLADGRTLGVSSMLDLNHLETSYLVDFDREKVFTIPHVPLVRASAYLTLYEYVGSPIQVKEEKKVFAEIEASGYLALAKDNSQYQEWTEESLKKCQKFRKVFYCPDNVRYMRARASCLTALYDGNSKIAHQLCPMNLVNQISKAVQLNESSYLITETQPQNMVVSCGDKKRKYPIQGTITLTMARSCVASTSNIVIEHPPMAAEVTLESRMVTTPLDFTEMIEEVESEDFIQTAEDMMTHVGQKIPIQMVRTITKINKNLGVADHFQSIGTWLLSYSPGSFGSIVTSLAILAVTIIIIYKCSPCCLQMIKSQLCRKQNNNYPTPGNNYYEENQVNQRKVANHQLPELPRVTEGEGDVHIHAPTSAQQTERLVIYRTPTTSPMEKSSQNPTPRCDPVMVVGPGGEEIHPTHCRLALAQNDTGVDSSIKEYWTQELSENPTSYTCSPPPVSSPNENGIERKDFQDITEANKKRSLIQRMKTYKKAVEHHHGGFNLHGLRAAVSDEPNLDEKTLSDLMDMFLKENLDLMGIPLLKESPEFGTFAEAELNSIQTYPFRRASKNVTPDPVTGVQNLKQVEKFLKKNGKQRETFLANATYEQEATLKRFEEEIFKRCHDPELFKPSPGESTTIARMDTSE